VHDLATNRCITLSIKIESTPTQDPRPKSMDNSHSHNMSYSSTELCHSYTERIHKPSFETSRGSARNGYGSTITAARHDRLGKTSHNGVLIISKTFSLRKNENISFAHHKQTRYYGMGQRFVMAEMTYRARPTVTRWRTRDIHKTFSSLCFIEKK
jgi:hypothetical protein